VLKTITRPAERTWPQVATTCTKFPCQRIRVNRRTQARPERFKRNNRSDGDSDCALERQKNSLKRPVFAAHRKTDFVLADRNCACLSARKSLSLFVNFEFHVEH
jgi:hypothetical protein